MAIDDGPVIVGGGPSGLAAAIELRGARDLAGDRDRARAGGGRHPAPLRPHRLRMRDLRTVLSGPRYAERYRELAADAGVEVLAETMVTDWEGGPLAEADGPAGPLGDRAARRGPRHGLPRAPPLGAARPRLPARRRDDDLDPPAARPSARPEGGAAGGDRRRRARQLLGGRDPGARRRLGGRTGHRAAAATSRWRRFRAGAAVRYRAPVWTRTEVSAIHGSERVESVELTELDSGRTRTVQCDLVIFTADWIPDHELAVMAGCELDPGSLGPLVDPALRTTRQGVFATGNLLHPAETADVCALDGRHVAAICRRIPARTG